MLRSVARTSEELQPWVARTVLHFATFRGMEPWRDWRKRAKEWKKDNRLTDADIAANMPPDEKGETISRATVQAWLGGRNQPNISGFMDFCAAMGADPGLILFGRAVLPNAVEPTSQAHATMRASPTAHPGHGQLMTRLRSFKQKKAKLRRTVLVK